MKTLQHACLMLLAVPLYIAPTISARAMEITVDGTTCILGDAITAANTDTETNGCAAGDDRTPPRPRWPRLTARAR